jgi:uncharacterized membrane protein
MKKFLLLTMIVAATATAAYAQFTYTSLDFPGGDATTARGINNSGDIVGAYRITNTPPRHALLIRRGQLLPLAPSTVLAADYSEALKINDRGDVVGQYITDDGVSHGFLLSKGVVTTLDFPGASDTYAFDINEAGVVVGYWDILDALGNVLATHGFVWTNGTFSEVNFPDSADSVVLGINAEGEYVGERDSDITSTVGHAFLYTDGHFTSFDFPEATLTQADDINERGQIVGVYIDGNCGTHGFLKSRDSYTSIDFPGAAVTAAWGINDRGQIVGVHRDTVGAKPRGFIAQRQE